MYKVPFQSFKITQKNEIVGIFLKYKETGFEFDFDTFDIVKKEIPNAAKPFELGDLEYIPEELQWAVDCLKSNNPLIWTSELGIVKFGRPYTGPKISDDLEAALFPRHELKPELPKKASSSCDYFDEYDGKKKKKK